MEIKEILTRGNLFKYQLLGRLIEDCNTFLGTGNRNEEKLWAKNIEEQIAVMIALFDSFSEEEKPQWTTRKEILDYRNMMS